MEVGVVIGRFQVESLHEGHRYLINEAFRHHKKVIIFIGCARIQGTKYDPLDYPTRERMLRAAYPDALILPVHDMLSDEEWSRELDKQIRGVVPNLTGARLYGGRDSFKTHYQGDFTAVDIESGIQYMNGREQREAIGRAVRSTSDFRAGVIYSTQNAFPYVKLCVDIACTLRQEEETFILLGKKPHENKWRLPGGMVDKKDKTVEQAAMRELIEETGVAAEPTALQYVGSFPVGDWRFKNAGEIGLMTALFTVPYQFGGVKAGDDLAEVKWVRLSKAEREVVKSHKALVSAVRRHHNVE